MDKEKLQKLLKELLNDQVRAMATEGDFSELINNKVQEAMVTLQEQLAGNPHAGATESRESDVLAQAAITNSQLNGNILVTPSGTWLDLTRKKTPFMRLSKQLEDWAHDFATYIRSDRRIIGKTLQEMEDPDGGYLVPEEFRAVMVMYDAESAIVWPRATIWPMGTDKLGMPKLAQRPDGIENDNYDHFAGVVFTWTDEGGTKTETEPSFEFIELIAHELSGYTAVTNILIDDSAINLMNFLTQLFRSAWVWQTDKSFIRQDGANKPLGVVQDPLILTVNRQTAGTVTYTDLNEMWRMLPAPFDSGAVWFMNKNVVSDIRNERDTNNALLLQQTYQSISDDYRYTIFGMPVIPSDGKTYQIGTKGDVILGNWKYYYIGDRQDFRFESSPHYLFRSNKMALRVSSRLDGQPAIPEAFVVLDDVAAAS